MRWTALRFAAFGIDVGLLAAILVLPQAILGFGFGLSLFNLSGFADLLGIEAFVLLTVSLPSWLYFILGDASAGGATIGKRALRMRVVQVDGNRVSLPRVVLRTLVKMTPWELTHTALLVPVPLFAAGAVPTLEQTIRLALVYVVLFVQLGVIIKTEGTRGLHDLAARTRVLRLEGIQHRSSLE